MTERKPLLLKQTSRDALELLRSRPKGVKGEGDTYSDQKILERAEIRGVIFPWMASYRIWWAATAVAAIATVFFCPFQMAFQHQRGEVQGWSDVVELVLTGMFVVDIGVNFMLAFYKDEQIIFERSEIVKYYINGMFWVDLTGVFPFETLALWLTGNLSHPPLLFSLFRLLRFVRLHRMKKLSDILQYDARVSLLGFTMLRNFAALLAVTHLEACSMYFLARLHDFSGDTWLGPLVNDMSGFDRYVTSLYWSIVTFCTVGYGDFAPANAVERLWGSIFMLVNVVVAAWIIGSITLLIVKGDEKTGEYRDSLQVLQQYGEMNRFDTDFSGKLKAQLRLEFNNREISDEQVLKHFPSAVRRKILRKLYLAPLEKTQLMRGVRQQFVDAFLAYCTVEIFSPGDEVVERGAIISDLFLLVGGVAESSISGGLERSSIARRKFQAGDFIGDIGFFTESPQVDTVVCLTLCKTLTITQEAYKLLGQDHPGSVGKILTNLLEKVRAMQVALPKRLEVLRAGSVFDTQNLESELSYDSLLDAESGTGEYLSNRKETLTAVADLVKMHMDKQLDDQTTRLLFAASRGDTATISLMCDQGFNPNNADYDNRTALMVASMKGNTDVVRLLLEYKADPNMVDMHGSTALLEAVKNGNEVTMDILLTANAQLNMSESLAASVLCQAVFDGDIVLLRRLLKAGIQVNAADYDQRTPAHIAAAEGNVAAIRVLAEFGADLSLKDRWQNTAAQEARQSQQHVVEQILRSQKAVTK
eukprot:Nitzschia sp. Nitz4//scaffold130_size63480//11956//14232//NITZ4_006241-RA/size63480-processed-gene-0.76-mRNA-1//1//CDS//3329535165//6666//frame0